MSELKIGTAKEFKFLCDLLEDLPWKISVEGSCVCGFSENGNYVVVSDDFPMFKFFNRRDEALTDSLLIENAQKFASLLI